MNRTCFEVGLREVHKWFMINQDNIVKSAQFLKTTVTRALQDRNSLQ